MSLLLKDLQLPLAEFTLRVDAELSASITGLFGPSGSGKTTLLELIAGLRRPQHGQIVLHGRPLTHVSQRLHIPPERRQVGYVPQDLALFPHLSAGANLTYGHQPGPANAVSLEKVIDVLELTPLLKRPIQRLSGGERQRIALGRALLASPRILLLDEPLSSLDERLKERILPYIQAIHREFRIPMVYVTHSQREIEALCDSVLHLHQGQLHSPPPI